VEAREFWPGLTVDMSMQLAIATLSAPVEMVGGPLGQKSWSRRFYGSSRMPPLLLGRFARLSR